MDSKHVEMSQAIDRILAQVPSGLSVLAAVASVEIGALLLARWHRRALPDSIALRMVCFIFAWSFLSMWQVIRGCARLGLDRSSYADFLLAKKTTDPDEAFLWRWTIHEFCAFLALGLLVLLLTKFQ